MGILGVGFGAFISTATIAATDSVKDQQQGLAAGLLNSAQQIGGSLGIALLVTLASEHAKALAGSGKAAQAGGYAFGFAAAAAVGLMAAILAAVTLPGRGAGRGTPTRSSHPHQPEWHLAAGPGNDSGTP
jgi:MFS family permease